MPAQQLLRCPSPHFVRNFDGGRSDLTYHANAAARIPYSSLAMTAHSVPDERLPGQRQRVAIDLIALGQFSQGQLPIRLVHGLIRHALDVDFILLARTGPAADGTLAQLEADNVRGVAVPGPSVLQSLVRRAWARVPGQHRRARLARRLGWSRQVRTLSLHWRPTVLARLHADVVFCPFTSSRASDPAVPLVAAIHDLQHLSHPHLLTSAQRAVRAREFDATGRRASRLLSSASSLRNVALQSEDVVPEQIQQVSPGRLLIPPAVAEHTVEAALVRHGIRRGGYVLLAADVEPRQNHGLALAAWGLFRARHPDCETLLVCAGGPDMRLTELRTTAERMGLAPFVRFTGALATAELAALVQGCRALIVPALYDALGDTVLEAMALGRPVLCSQLPDLAELTGAAALMFDPHRPTDLAAAFERIEEEPRLLEELAALGRARITQLDNAASVAEAYLSVFRAVGAEAPRRWSR
jgi:glycosyltransferase involved in cell wall biosynthesis